MNDLQRIYVADDTYGEFSVSHYAFMRLLRMSCKLRTPMFFTLIWTDKHKKNNIFKRFQVVLN